MPNRNWRPPARRSKFPEPRGFHGVQSLAGGNSPPFPPKFEPNGFCRLPPGLSAMDSPCFSRHNPSASRRPRYHSWDA
jgi:hypothetical protein